MQVFSRAFGAHTPHPTLLSTDTHWLFQPRNFLRANLLPLCRAGRAGVKSVRIWHSRAKHPIGNIHGVCVCVCLKLGGTLQVGGKDQNNTLHNKSRFNVYVWSVSEKASARRSGSLSAGPVLLCFGVFPLRLCRVLRFQQPIPRPRQWRWGRRGLQTETMRRTKATSTVQ